MVFETDSETGSSVVFPTVFCCVCNGSRFLTMTDVKKKFCYGFPSLKGIPNSGDELQPLLRIISSCLTKISTATFVSSIISVRPYMLSVIQSEAAK